MRQLVDPGGRRHIVLVPLLLAAMGAMTAQAVAQAIPLPPPRPADPQAETAPAKTAEPEPAKPSDASSSTVAADACIARLRSAGFVVEPVGAPAAGDERCRIEAPVRLMSVPVEREKRIELKDRPTLACAFAENLGSWLRDLVGPAIVGHLQTDLTGVESGPGFECRNRNRAASGKLSAHAEGRALDIAAFELANGRKLSIKPAGDRREEGAIAVIRKAACGWFTTILGPGSDPSHADHLHVDVLQHGSSDRYRICE